MEKIIVENSEVESLEDLLEFESELVSTCNCNGSDKC